MPDTLPIWFWLPAAVLLWGYLAVDALARRHNNRKVLSMRTIVIARTKAEAQKRFPNAVAIVTPRSPHAARGIEADRIVTTRSMDDHPQVLDLFDEARPSLVTSREASAAVAQLAAAGAPVEPGDTIADVVANDRGAALEAASADDVDDQGDTLDLGDDDA